MKKTEITKERLIEAAAEIFAEKGFRKATIAEICEKAEANIAAVNYHFGDKENLYSEVWKNLSDVATAFAPIPDSHEETGAEAWLRLFMRSRLQTIFSEQEASLFPRLIHHEMSEPTAQHETIIKTYLLPNLNRVTAAVRDLLGEGFSEEQIELATINYMGIHIFLNVGHQKHKADPERCHRLPEAFNEQLMQQVEDFAIGGLKTIKGTNA